MLYEAIGIISGCLLIIHFSYARPVMSGILEIVSLDCLTISVCKFNNSTIFCRSPQHGRPEDTAISSEFCRSELLKNVNIGRDLYK